MQLHVHESNTGRINNLYCIPVFDAVADCICWLACIELVGVVLIFCESVVLIFDGSISVKIVYYHYLVYREY